MKKFLPLLILFIFSFSAIHAEVTHKLSDDGTLTISGTSMPYYGSNRNVPWCNDRDKIRKVVIMDGVTNIGNYVFYICKNLTSVTIPNSVTSIGRYAFYYCPALTSVTIPNSVTSIDEKTFVICPGLTSITVEKGNTKYDSRDNCNAIIETNNNKLILGCQNTVIPNSVTSIGYHAFEWCSALTSIKIPNSVTSIGEAAFNACESLTSVEIPNFVTSIGEDAFSNCLGLTSVEIGNSITSIERQAFYGCSALTSITLKGSTPPEFGGDVFGYVDKSIPVYVPANSIEAYKSALGGFGFTNIKALKLIALADNTPYTMDSQSDGVDVSFTRYFSGNWEPLYIPFSLSYEDWKDDFEVARINGIHQYDDDDDGDIDRTVLEFVKVNDNSVVYPSTPYIIKAKTPGNKTIYVENTTVYESEEKNIECSTTTEKFTFIGNYDRYASSTINTYGYYVMEDGLLSNKPVNVFGPYRWYMKIEERESVYGINNNTAKEISISVVGEEATGIANIQHASPNTQTYDLNGRKVNENNLKPGMYVKNGRKFVIK